MEFGMGFGFGWGASFDVFSFSFWDTWSPVWALERLDFPGILVFFFFFWSTGGRFTQAMDAFWVTDGTAGLEIKLV